MKNSDFEHQAYESLSKSLLEHIDAESDRGFVLIATSCIDEFMMQIFEAILPTDLNTKSKKKQIFGYPGCLDSLSAKVELSYVCRLINIEIYEAINILRKIRNYLAHGSAKFSIKEENQLKKLYEILNITDKEINNLIENVFRLTIKHVREFDKKESLLNTLKILEASGFGYDRMVLEIKKIDIARDKSDQEIHQAILFVLNKYLNESTEEILENYRKKINGEQYFWRFKLFVCTHKICTSIAKSVFAIKQVYEKNETITEIFEKINEQ